MPARDFYHNQVINALVKDGWTITHDPYRIKVGRKTIYVDLGATQIIAAENDRQKIAVEVKSFVGKSDVADLEKALGQFMLYQNHLREVEPERVLYMAVTQEAFRALFEEPIGAVLLKNKVIQIIVFDRLAEEILKWID